MVIYWAMFLVPAIGALLERERGVGEKMSGLYPLLVCVFFLIAFRETGGDFQTYSDQFHLISRLDFFQSVAVTEPAYGGLNWISNQFDADIYGVNAVCAVIFLGGFAYFCAPERRPVLMLTIATAYLIIVVVVGYTRQGTAIGIELIGLRMLMQRRIVPYFVCVLLAMTFHRSAMILLPFAYYALPKQTGATGRFIAVATLAGALYVVLSQFSAENETLYANYVESSHYSSDGALVRSVMNLAAAFTLIVNRRRWALRWNDRDIWMAFSIASVGVTALTFVASTAADRIGLYLIPLQVIVFARLPTLWARLNPLPVIAVVALFGATFGVWLHLGNYAGELWLPYKSLLLGVVP